MSKWYDMDAKESDIVLSSRIRLARNLSNHNFMPVMEEEEEKTLVDEVVGQFNKDYPDTYKPVFLSQCTESRKKALNEKRIINSHMANKSIGAVLISEDEGLEIMVNAEDHIRIQTLSNGMNLNGCLERADKIDDYIDSHFDYAYDTQYGYKTTFPTNAGTGLRASYTLHLPGLSRNKRLNRLGTELGRFGMKIKPIYGYNDTGLGDLFQISTQKSLGHTEQEFIRDLTDVVTQMISQEREQRRRYYEKDRFASEDMAYKSYGVLKYARKLSLKDAMTLISELMLGMSLKIISTEDGGTIPFNKIIMDIQPAVINNSTGKSLSVEETEVIRAQYLRNNLPEII